eukprot:1355734-Amorphochlora_amoeboformis.AAC.1
MLVVEHFRGSNLRLLDRVDVGTILSNLFEILKHAFGDERHGLDGERNSPNGNTGGKYSLGRAMSYEPMAPSKDLRWRYLKFV